MIEQAIKIAKRSSTGKYMMGCVIVSGVNDRIVSNGWAHVPEWNYWPLYSLHAELHALARARHMNLHGTGSTAYIAAVSRKSGAYTMARPCKDCAVALFAAGIVRIVYTMSRALDLTPTTQSESLHYAMDDVESFKTYNSPQY